MKPGIRSYQKTQTCFSHLLTWDLAVPYGFLGCFQVFKSPLCRLLLHLPLPPWSLEPPSFLPLHLIFCIPLAGQNKVDQLLHLSNKHHWYEFINPIGQKQFLSLYLSKPSTVGLSLSFQMQLWNWKCDIIMCWPDFQLNCLKSESTKLSFLPWDFLSGLYYYKLLLVCGSFSPQFHH